MTGRQALHAPSELIGRHGEAERLSALVDPLIEPDKIELQHEDITKIEGAQ